MLMPACSTARRVARQSAGESTTAPRGRASACAFDLLRQGQGLLTGQPRMPEAVTVDAISTITPLTAIEAIPGGASA